MESQTEEVENALTALAHPEAFSRIKLIREFAALADVRFGETVSDEKLKAWEKQHDCNLPLEYRLFLRVVGNGAFGHPHVALPPLALKEFPSPEEALALSMPFPLSATWPNASDTTPHAQTFSGREALPRLKGGLWLHHHYESEACPMMTGYFLVVRGARVGEVWSQVSIRYSDDEWDLAVSDGKPFLFWYASMLAQHLNMSRMRNEWIRLKP